MLTREELQKELHDLEKIVTAVKATGGFKYRRLFQASDREIDEFCGKSVNMLRLLLLRALAGEIIAERWGKTFDLELTVQDLVVLSRPEPAKVPAAVAIASAIAAKTPLP